MFAWAREVEQPIAGIGQADVTTWYRDNSKPWTVLPAWDAAEATATVGAPTTVEDPRPLLSIAALSHLQLAAVYKDQPAVLVGTDMASGAVFTVDPRAPSPAVRRLGKLRSVAHADLVDLDGDGHVDVLAADLGLRTPTDAMSFEAS